MNGNVLIIALCAALLFAVGILLFGVGRMVYGITRYYLFERKPERHFEHPDFGVLSSDDSLWAATVQRAGRDIPILVGGTERAPNERLLRQTQHLLSDFTTLESRATTFLRSREPELRDLPLEFYMLVVADEHRPEDFAFEFLGTPDDRVWRVEFVGGEPKETGFDD